jgi:large subunit ribosomal protein L23
MKNPYDVIKNAHITEKSAFLGEKGDQYVFEVSRDATKLDIKRAVEVIFKKKVKAVNTLNVHAKVKGSRMGRAGKSAQWKKAIVTLTEGQKLEFV